MFHVKHIKGIFNMFHMKRCQVFTYLCILFHVKKFTSKTQKVGELGEKVACQYLKKNGFLILDTNFSSKMGEIDIVAKKKEIIYFIEVKSITLHEIEKGIVSGETISPEENFHIYKAKKFIKTVEYYILVNNVPHETEMCVSLITVRLNQNKGTARVKMYDNVV